MTLECRATPTPYYIEWPSRSSYFGVADFAGMPVCGIRATKERGKVTVTCSGEGLEECKITLESK